MRPQVDSFGDARQRLAPDEMSMPAGKIAFGLVRKPPPQKLGDYETEHPIAEEFEALVAALAEFPTPTATLGDECAGMGQGLFEQLAAGELVADNLWQVRRGHVSSRRETAGCSGSRTAIARTSTRTRRSRKR